MPKKFGTNTKSADARAKKEEKRLQDRAAKEKQEEDELWRDDDKQLNKKMQRKDNREQKRVEQLERKKELAQMHDEEMASLKCAKAGVEGSQQEKLSQAEIRAAREERARETALANSRKDVGGAVVRHDPLLIENTNRMEVEGEEARTVDEAIKTLSFGDSGPTERHPERRLKAAFKAYESRMLPQLKAENPNMKLSQLKDLVFKSFQTSPENPKNQQHLTYNAKR